MYSFKYTDFYAVRKIFSEDAVLSTLSHNNSAHYLSDVCTALSVAVLGHFIMGFSNRAQYAA